MDDTAVSVLSILQQQAVKVAEEKTHDIDIPGYSGQLFCRYRFLDPADISEIRKKIKQESNNETEQLTALALDTLILACDEFFARSGDKEIPLSKLEGIESQGLPVRYDAVLATALGLDLPDPPSARNVVITLFGGNVLAAQAHSSLVSQWMMQINVGMGEDLGGI